MAVLGENVILHFLMCGHLTDSQVKQLKEMAKANYDMYCERHREGE